MIRSKLSLLVATLVLVCAALSSASSLSAQCCVDTRGNVDDDPSETVDIGDLMALVDHLFIAFAPLACDDEADVDGVSGVDIGDLMFIVDHLFISFTPMPNCPGGGGTGPQLGDLLITEIMMDPNALADNVGEWFEVANLSGDSIDIQGLLFTGATAADTFRVNSSIILGPFDFCTFARSNNPGFTPRYVYAGMNLDNGSDEISMSYDGLLLDKVTWTFSLIGASRSLRYLGYNYLFNDADSNWCPSIVPMLNGDFGSPNTIGASACDFNISPLTAGAVIFSEFMADPTDVDDATGEWFEVHNPSDTMIYNLEGCVIKRSSTDSIVIAGQFLIYPGDYLVFGRSVDAAGGFQDYVYSGLALANTGSTTLTLSKAGLVIDQASLSAPTTGKSRALDPTKMDAVSNDNLSNWCDQTIQYDFNDIGSPGFQNDPCTP